LEQQIAAESRAVALSQEELDINQTLADKKFVQNTRLLALKRQVAQLEAERGEHIANQSRVRQNVIDLELRKIDLQNQYRQKATDELETSARKVQELLERLRPYEDAKVRLHIDAPVAGTIVNLRVHTLGGVIAPGEPILDIVPHNSPLIVEGKVAIANIDELRLGMEADVHLVAYNRRTTPLAKGKVVYISADSLTSPKEQAPYYLVRVEVEQHSLDQIGGIKLAPGMPADLYIQTQARTALEYMLEPVTQVMLRAFREQ
jgi:HlyD family type I secretion membrane fusion protein